MAPTLSDRTVKDWVWKRTGLSPTELPEPVLDAGIAAAITEFSRYKIKSAFGTLPIVLNQTNYPYPDGTNIPTTITEITDFFYGPNTIIGNLSFEDELLTSIQGNVINLDFGGNIFESPTLVGIWFQKLKQFRANIGLPGWRIVEGNPRILQLYQTPNQAGVAYWEGNDTWTVGQILPGDYEAFTKCVLWKASEARGMKLAVAKDYYEYGGIRMSPAFDFWDKMAKKFKDEFIDDVGGRRGVMVVG